LARALEGVRVPLTYVLIAAEPNALACTPLVITCQPGLLPMGPAGHEAGLSPTARHLLEGIVAGEPDPPQTTVHRLVEASSGLTVEW
jgi:hypothetical protein